MIMIEIQYKSGYRGLKGFHEAPPFDGPLTLFDKLLKILGKLKSVYCIGHSITYHNIQMMLEAFYRSRTSTLLQ